MTDARSFLSAVMDMSTGVLHQHGYADLETGVTHGPLDHIAVAGSVLDAAQRQRLIGEGDGIRAGMVDTAVGTDGDGVVLSVSRDDSDGYDLDIFVPLTASVIEAHAIVKEALDAYVERHFG